MTAWGTFRNNVSGCAHGFPLLFAAFVQNCNVAASNNFTVCDILFLFICLVRYNLYGVRFWHRYLDDDTTRELGDEDAERVAAGAAFTECAEAAAALAARGAPGSVGGVDGQTKRQRVGDVTGDR